MSNPPDLLVLVCGSRDWTNRRSIVERLLQEPDGTTIIQGAAPGADAIAAQAAGVLGFKVIPVRADWSIYGNAAGPIRNRKIARDGYEWMLRSETVTMVYDGKDIKEHECKHRIARIDKVLKRKVKAK